MDAQQTLALENHLDNLRQKVREFIEGEILAVNLNNSDDELDRMQGTLEVSIMNSIKHSLAICGANFKGN